MTLYKKHLVGKYTYRQYGQGGALSRTKVQRNHTDTCLIYASHNVNFNQEATNNNE